MWLKDSKEFNSSKKLTRRDGGVYQLKTMNKFGFAIATVTVTVGCKFKLIFESVFRRHAMSKTLTVD